MFPDHGSDGTTLTKHADIAMYLAKTAGKNDFRFFSPDNRPQSSHRGGVETTLDPHVGSPELQPDSHAFAPDRRNH